MRRCFARVKWLAREIRKSWSSKQDLAEPRVVVAGNFVPAFAGFSRNLGGTWIPSQKGTT